MKKNNTARKTFEKLLELYPQAQCALQFQTPFQLLVATILSAQCTDKRVNMVTPVLFQKFPLISDLATANEVEVSEIIKSTGFFRNKTKSIIGSAKMIMNTFAGRVPETMEELLKLPGVARKTANVVLYNAFGKNVGVVVDTHVSRISQRLGWTKFSQPEKIERDLITIIPTALWGKASHVLIDFGREICKAPKPLCQNCQLTNLCPWFQSNYNQKHKT